MGQFWSDTVDEDDSDCDINMAESCEAMKDCLPEIQNDFDICLDSATDTSLDSSSFSTKPLTLTLNQLSEIEDQLEPYEKVALVYLLCLDPNEALELCTRLLAGTTEKIVYNWGYHQNISGQKWQEQLIEALAVIQNYKILKTVGFKRDDLRIRLSPHLSFMSFSINKIRKGLYLMLCEGFDNKDLEAFLQCVYLDFGRKGFKFKMLESSFPELFLLYWETIGYIKTNNLKNLCGVLKRMELFELSENVKSLVPEESDTNLNVEATPPEHNKSNKGKMSSDTYDRIFSRTTSLAELVSMPSLVSDNANYMDDNRYFINPKNPGHCLIINQENFHREIDPNFAILLPSKDVKLEERSGTQKDKEQLENTFKKFGFTVEIVDNLIHTDMIKKICGTIDKVREESSLFICILSHGDEGVVYGANSCKVYVKAIQSLMCSRNRKHLNDKPKILILQSCQGNRCQKVTPIDEEEEDIATDGPSSLFNNETVPPKADLFTFWATVPGFGAIRDRKKGTWFIQTLCKKMEELGDRKHFEDICTATNYEITGKKCVQWKEQVAMVPLKETTLRKAFYLPNMREV